MSTIPNETIEKLSALQNQIWQTTSSTVSEAANLSVTFGSPLTVAARTADLYAEMSVPMMVIQFAFAATPDDPQVILIPQEAIMGLVEAIQGSSVDEIDENIVADLRAPMEAIVQGLCLAVGSIRNDMVVATGMSIRYQIFSFPPNLQRHDRVARTQIAITADDITGSLIWLLDNETAHYIVGDEVLEDDSSPFMRIGDDGQPVAHPAGRSGREDINQLDLLLDVPLEISVELGRVKMLVRDVLDLGNGSILEIDKSAGEPVDVLVNGRLMARGEVVVIEDNFGVRITEIINPNEKDRPGQRGSVRFWVIAATCCLSGVCFAGDGIFGTKSTPMPAMDTSSSVGVFPIIQMAVALVLVLALVKWVMPSAIKRFGKNHSRTSGSGIRVDETVTIGPANLAVVTVRGRVLLVGSTADHVTCLADLTPTAPEPQTFQEVLESAPADAPTGPGSLTDLAGQLERLRRIGA